jgi:translation initiation factor IF-3
MAGRPDAAEPVTRDSAGPGTHALRVRERVPVFLGSRGHGKGWAPRAWHAGPFACGGEPAGRAAPAGRPSLSAQGRDNRRSQGGHISVEPRINERIRVPEVRLVGPAGEQVGIVSINDALRLAQEADLDLVEVAPTARPPVCKLMDYGKFKYESALKARESRKNQAQTIIKEIKLRPKIDPHDYGTKKSHVERFLRQGDKVKVTIMFRGREQSRPELGFRLLQRLAGDVEELGFVESQPRQDGRNMIMVIGPHRRKSDARSEARAERATRDAEHGERPLSRSRAAVRDADAGEQPAEAQPAAEVQPAEAQPAAEVQPAEAQPAEAQPAEAQPAEVQPAEASEPVQGADTAAASAPDTAASAPDTAAASAPEAGEAQPRPKPAPVARSGPARVAAASRASARS